MEKSDHQFRELLDRYLKGTATPAERETLEQFFESYQADGAGHQTLDNEDVVRDRLLRKIHLRVGTKKKSRRIAMTFWLPLAAAIAVFVVAYFFSYVGEKPSLPDTRQAVLIQDSTGARERIVKVLPDGSIAHLNHRTTLTYPETFGNVREISITGEVFFDVVNNGKPFVVHSGDVTTEVLGTSFNIRHRQGSATEITLVEGKVNVIVPNEKSLELRPAEQVVIGENIIKRDVNVLRYTGWKDNTLFFEQTTFEQAIRDIEEWYDVDIDIANPSLMPCIITAKYQDEPLGNVLSSFEFLLGLTIKRLDDAHFLVDGEGC